MSQLSILYKEHGFISSTRSELYSQTDFIANCGGLLSLFTGISLLSCVEMLYYCTLRLGCALLRQRKKFENQRQNMISVPSKSNDITVIPINRDERPVGTPNSNTFDTRNAYGKTDTDNANGYTWTPIAEQRKRAQRLGTNSNYIKSYNRSDSMRY